MRRKFGVLQLLDIKDENMMIRDLECRNLATQNRESRYIWNMQIAFIFGAPDVSTNETKDYFATIQDLVVS